MKKIFTTAFVLGVILIAPTAFANTADYTYFWSFDEGTGRSVNDSVGGQNGVMTGTSGGFGWASGKVGTGIGMDGAAGTGIVLPDAFLKGSQGSISLWFNPQSLTDQNIVFSGKSTTDNNIYAALMIDRDGRPQLQFRDTSYGADRKAQGTHLLSVNEWVNFVITANGQGYHMYVNGVEMTVAGENIGRWFPDMTNHMFMYRIGTLSANPLSGSFNGYLDDFKMYNRVLTNDEVTILFNEGNMSRPTIPAMVAAKTNLSISEDHIPFGGSVAINWTSVNTDSCSGSWGSTVATSGSMVFVKIGSDTTYSLSCGNKYGTDTSMAHVIIGTTTASTGTGLVVTSIVVGGTPPAPTSAQFAKNLALGARGDEVKALQQSLVAKGYLAGNLPMGYFGPLTKAAVMKFQKENSLPSTGFVGPMTRAVLNK